MSSPQEQLQPMQCTVSLPHDPLQLAHQRARSGAVLVETLAQALRHARLDRPYARARRQYAGLHVPRGLRLVDARRGVRVEAADQLVGPPGAAPVILGDFQYTLLGFISGYLFGLCSSRVF